MKASCRVMKLSLLTAVLGARLVYADAPVVNAGQASQPQQPAAQSQPGVNQQPNQQQQPAPAQGSGAPQSSVGGMHLEQAGLPDGTGGGYTQSLSTEQRLARLEQQVRYLVQLNIPQKMTALQQSIAQLNGRLAVQKHDVDTLNTQQRAFYNDLNRRLNQMNNLSGNNTPPVASPEPAKKSAPRTAEPAKKPAVNASASSDAAAYRAAFASIGQRRYPQAQSALKAYLADYPKGQFRVNAHYWLGEIDLLQNNQASAENEFNTVVTRFPNSNKVADAMLKLGLLAQKQGKTQEAQAKFARIQSDYPNTTAAQLARLHSQQMQQA